MVAMVLVIPRALEETGRRNWKMGVIGYGTMHGSVYLSCPTGSTAAMAVLCIVIPTASPNLKTAGLKITMFLAAVVVLVVVLMNLDLKGRWNIIK